MATLEKALDIAYKAHKGQVDKSGHLYILHPLRVMLKQKSDKYRIVAILHDIVEDTYVTLYDLTNMDFSKDIVDAVDAITRREGETVKKYYQRVMANEIAIKVKIADLEDNLDITRLLTVKDKDLKRVHMYHQYWKKLKTMVYDD